MSSSVKRWWLYVLKLEQDKWYVGITSKTPEVRFRDHKNNWLAAGWTKKYKPLKIHYAEDLGICEIERAQLYEGRVTRKYMEKYDDNNVRGGDLTDMGDYKRCFGRIFLKEDLHIALYALVTSVMLFYFLIEMIFSDR